MAKADVPLRFHPGRGKYAFFISYVREDGAEARELKAEIARISSRDGRTPLDSFLDVHDWPLGNDIRGAILENLRLSRYMIAWITPRYVRSKRGWAWFELAYAESREEELNLPSERLTFPFIIPVFQGVKITQIDGTPLLKYWERKLPLPTDRRTPIDEIAKMLVGFHDQEASRRGGVSK